MSVEAKKNIKNFGLQDRIKIYEGDAVGLLNDKTVDLSDDNTKFDFLFVDAAKSKYIEFIEGSLKHLNKDAVIICDNILMGARVASDEYDSKHKHRTNIRH
ncbi:MAG: class I SAM-dependent methyltransferase [Clostridia bacterium]|nr:class I SAM-dependent methyltransferase [Clostridia bacterium]